MYIKKVELENFSNIKTGLNTNYICIDFSNRQHQICVLKGDNGKGKTSLLSYLTPFATLGSLDVRDRHNLILDNKVGDKKITIVDNSNNEIIIHHIYTPAKDKNHTIKSFFELNGKELNENGNTSSFKDLVKQFLGLDIDYLKLLRLGDNVTNLIKQLSTERKNFMSKILDETDVYLKCYNKINGDVRDLKNFIGHITDKLNKLNIEDIDTYKEEIKNIENKIIDLDNELNLYKDKLAVIIDNINRIGDTSEIVTELKSLTGKSERFKNREDVMTTKELHNTINDLTKQIQQATVRMEVLKEKYSLNMDDIDKLNLDISILKNDLSKDTSVSIIDNLEKQIQEMKLRINNIKDNLGNFTTEVTKVEFDEFVVFLKNSQKMLLMTYEFGKEPIIEALSLIKSKRSLEKYMAKAYLLNEPNDEKTYLDKLIDKYKNVKISCETNCVLKQVLTDLLLPLEIRRGNNEVKKTQEFYNYVEICYNNILNIIRPFSDYSDIIDRLPPSLHDMFTVQTVYDKISNCDFIYDDKIINDYMSYMAEYDNKQKLQSHIIDLEEKLELNKAVSRASSLKQEISDKSNKVKLLTNKSDEMNDDLSNLRYAITELNNKLDYYNDLLLVTEKCEDINKRIDEINDTLSALSEYKVNYKKYTSLVDECSKDKNKLNSIYNGMRYNLSQYSDMIKELNKLKDIYQDLTMLKNAYSTKSGIPLNYIQMYLSDTKELANKMLDIVYGGDIELKDFELTENEFNIPFYNKGVEISDIRYASQGESSFLSIAISFALSYQNLTDYNIPLIDEADSNLDLGNRMKFIDVIIHFINIIKGEQMFIITHNDMFSQYPVDVIDFDNLMFNNKKIIINK